MSACNISFGPAEILCTTDTMIYRQGDGAPIALADAKAHISASGAFAWAGRGATQALDLLGQQLTAQPSLEAAADWAAFLLPAYQHHRPPPIELHLMGWSDQRQALAVIRLRIRAADDLRRDDLAHGVSIAPAAAAFQPPPTATAAQLIKVALAQQAWPKRQGLKMSVGGLVHLTRIARDGITQEIAAAYPDYADSAERFGCPNAQAYATWRQSQRVAA